MLVLPASSPNPENDGAMGENSSSVAVPGVSIIPKLYDVWIIGVRSPPQIGERFGFLFAEESPGVLKGERGRAFFGVVSGIARLLGGESLFPGAVVRYG